MKYKMFKSVIFLSVLFFSAFLFVSCLQNNNVFDVAGTIKASDIIRTQYKTEGVGLYQGNGRFGCVYGTLGLHNHPKHPDDYGKSVYMHFDHYFRGIHNADFQLPVAKVYWENEPENVSNYSQRQSFYDGTVCTKFETSQYKLEVITWFDPVDRNLAGIRVRSKGKAPDIILEPALLSNIWYGQTVKQDAQITRNADSADISLSCGNTTTRISIRTNAATEIDNTNLRIRLNEGENNILISINENVKISAADSYKRSTDGWHEKWKNTGCLLLPDTDAQNMWVRSMALILSTYNDDGFGFSPPNGFSGNAWGFSFPQDISYIHPLFLSSGNTQIARSMIEYCYKRLDEMKAYTKRLFGVDGLFVPWEFPYGPIKGYHEPAPPVIFCYEIHNSGYLARMAHETAVFMDDEKWTKQYAVPLIKEIALFYKNICTKGDNGLWNIFITPSIGQDEMGGANQKDYLCALFSARYSFQKAIDYGLDDDGTYRKILSDGLNFPGLLSPRGFYYTCVGAGEKDFGKQKHPVQLNDLAFLPVFTTPQTPSVTAYNMRYDITQNADKPFFYGWTLGEFLLAGSRTGDTLQWKKDWNNILASDYTDKDWIQIYETSGAHDKSFYTTSNGLIAQSLLNNLVTDWFGKLEIGRCNPWQGKCRLYHIYSMSGVMIDGTIEQKSADLKLTAWKNCSFEINGKPMKMNKGEIQNIKINI